MVIDWYAVIKKIPESLQCRVSSKHQYLSVWIVDQNTFNCAMKSDPPLSFTSINFNFAGVVFDCFSITQQLAFTHLFRHSVSSLWGVRGYLPVLFENMKFICDKLACFCLRSLRCGLYGERTFDSMKTVNEKRGQ